MSLLKIVISLPLIFLMVVSQAKIPEYIPPFKIISDTLDENIPVGKCLITGVVTYHEKTVNEAVVKAYNHNKASGNNEMTLLVNSNKLGNIRMSVDSSTYFLTAWKPGTGTAYVEGVKFRSQHHIVIEIYLPDDEMIEVEKPVIYAYATQNIEAALKLETSFDLNFTYPIIGTNNTWDFNVSADGISIDNQYFPYLFWDAHSYSGMSHQYREGQLVGFGLKGAEVTSFLEKQLTSFGFNPREKTDFITYWAPRMAVHKYVVVNFLVDDAYSQISTLQITPPPDEIRRVFMLFSPVENEADFSNMKLQTPEYDGSELKRNGFTIVEWGGSELPILKL